jgi:hypothetical protein
MSKTWVLDTETKGTGAHMVPYEKTLRSGRRERELALVDLGGPAPEAKASPPAAPLLFKVVDVLGARVLAEGVEAREAVEVLEGVRSVLDVRIYQRIAASGRWRLLSLGEAKAMWEFRGRLNELAPAAAAAGA